MLRVTGRNFGNTNRNPLRIFKSKNYQIYHITKLKAMSKLMLSFTATFCATMCAILLYVERDNLSTSTDENIILSILFAVIAILSFLIFYKECNDWFHLNEE